MRKIIFQAEIDNKNAQKQLDKLNKEIEKSEEKLNKATGDKNVIEDQLNKAKDAATKTRKEIERLNAEIEKNKNAKVDKDVMADLREQRSAAVDRVRATNTDDVKAKFEEFAKARDLAAGLADQLKAAEADLARAEQPDSGADADKIQELTDKVNDLSMKSAQAAQEAERLKAVFTQAEDASGLTEAREDVRAIDAEIQRVQEHAQQIASQNIAEINVQLQEQNSILESQDKEVQKIQKQYDAANGKVQQITASLNQQQAAAGKLQENLSKAFDPAKLKASLNGMQAGLAGGFKTLLKYGIGIRSLFVLFNRLRQIITAGLKEFEKYDPATSKTMDNLRNGFAKLKASLTSAFAPILKVVEPVLTKLMNWLSKLIDYVGMFFTALSGKKTYTKAVASEKQYADSLQETGEEAKKATKYLSGLDEIRTYDTDKGTSSASSSGSADSGIMTSVEEVKMPAWMEKLADFMYKVRNFNFKTWWNEKVVQPIHDFDFKQWWNEHVTEPIQNFDLKGKWQEKVVKPIKEGWEKTKEDWNNNVVKPIKNLDIKGKWDEKVVTPIKEGWEKTKADWENNIATPIREFDVKGKWDEKVVTPIKEGWEKTKEGWENNIATPIREFDVKGKWQENIVKPIKDGLSQSAEDAQNWWTNDVSPWFTKERWEKLGKDTSEGFQSKFKSITGCDSPKEWWNTKAKPWLTKDKWETVGSDISTGFKDKFKSITGCNSVQEWWNSKAKPYLETVDWQNKGKEISSSFSNGFKAITGCDSLRQWWEEKVKPWFTWEKWKQLGKDAIDAITMGLKSIQLPKFHLTWGSETKAINLLGYTKYISVPWPHLDFYAKGGIVDKATLFGNSVVGEAGKEAIIPLERNTEWIRKVADQLADILADRLGSIFRTYQMPAVASGSLIPPRIEVELEGLDGIEKKLDTIINQMGKRGGGTYNFNAQINRKTLFSEVIQEAKMQQAANGRNPFLLA